MDKMMIFVVQEKEKYFLKNIQKYFQSKVDYVNVCTKYDMILAYANLKIDLYHREVRQNEKIIRLTDLEFRILHYLACQPGRVFTYQQIYEGVWGEEYAHEKGTIMSHIRHIRQKLEFEGVPFGYIENIRGVGYRFKEPMTDSS